MTRRDCALTLAALLGGRSLLARQQPDQNQSGPGPGENSSPVIRVNVDLVNILFTVHKKHGGELVPNLTKDDFTVFEDGKQQTIERFSRDTDLPLTLGLLVDVSASQMNLIEVERDAASAFFGSVIRPKDEAFLITFGKDTELLQDYTSSPHLLRAALGQMRGDEVGGPMMGRSPLPNTNPGPIPTSGNPKGTLLYDAIYLATNEKLKSEVGRKAVVLITDGEDQGSYYSRNQATESAQRANAIIYSIYYVDPWFYRQYGGFGGGDESGLRKMSDETGGRVFTVKKNHTLQEVFKEIQDEMRSQYSIGYRSTKPERDGSYRKIEIKTADKDDVVQARKGYYATPNDAG
jgi:VWFA-related protein